MFIYQTDEKEAGDKTAGTFWWIAQIIQKQAWEAISSGYSCILFCCWNFGHLRAVVYSKDDFRVQS